MLRAFSYKSTAILKNKQYLTLKYDKNLMCGKNIESTRSKVS